MPYMFNAAKGRFVEFAYRVKNNDPANSALLVVLLASTGLEVRSALEDADSLTAALAGATNEATNTGYARKTLTDADLGAIAPDDTLNVFGVTIPLQTWSNVTNTGTGAIGALLLCYDADTTSGTDSNIIPCTYHEFAITPDGSDVVARIAASGAMVGT